MRRGHFACQFRGRHEAAQAFLNTTEKINAPDGSETRPYGARGTSARTAISFNLAVPAYQW